MTLYVLDFNYACEHRIDAFGFYKTYHATCHAEASASKSTLAVRLRNEVSGNQNRSLTPEKTRTPPKVGMEGVLRHSESPAPTTPTGTKRKTEDNDYGHTQGTGYAPPSKRLATAACAIGGLGSPDDINM